MNNWTPEIIIGILLGTANLVIYLITYNLLSLIGYGIVIWSLYCILKSSTKEQTRSTPNKKELIIHG